LIFIFSEDAFLGFGLKVVVVLRPGEERAAFFVFPMAVERVLARDTCRKVLYY